MQGLVEYDYATTTTPRSSPMGEVSTARPGAAVQRSSDQRDLRREASREGPEEKLTVPGGRGRAGGAGHRVRAHGEGDCGFGWSFWGGCDWGCFPQRSVRAEKCVRLCEMMSLAKSIITIHMVPILSFLGSINVTTV